MKRYKIKEIKSGWFGEVEASNEMEARRVFFIKIQENFPKMTENFFKEEDLEVEEI